MYGTRSLVGFAVMAVVITMDPAGSVKVRQCPANELNFEKCTCTWSDTLDNVITVVNCTNTFLVNDTLLGSLLERTPHVQKVIFTGNYVPDLHVNVFGSCPSSSIGLFNLTYLDLSSNQIEIIHGQTFHCIPNLKTLILNDNLWHVEMSKNRIFSSMPQLTVLHLQDAFAKEYYSGHSKAHIVRLKNTFLNSVMYSLQELHLENNGFQYMDSDTFCELPSLLKLYLSNNKLAKINLQCLSHIQELHFDGNKLASLSEADMNLVANMTRLKNLTLYGNPFSCNDCTTSMANFRDWLKSPQSNVVYNKSELVCSDPDELKDKPIVSVSDGNMEGTCNNDPPFRRSKEVKIIIAGMVFLCIFLVIIILVVIHKDSIRNYKGGCWEGLRSKTRKVLTQQIHYGYDTMTDEEMFTIDA